MGLDTVELVMEVEEAFGITIPDAEAEKIQTVGHLYRYVLAKMGGPPTVTPGCLSAAAFYRLRRQLMGRYRVERRRIRPASALDELIPKSRRREAWRQLGEALGWKLPDLARPDWVWLAWLGSVIGLAVGAIAAWGRLAGFSLEAAGAVFVGFLFASILLSGAISRLTRPFATVLPAADIRGLIPMILVANFGTFRMSNPHGWNSREVWEALVSIISTQLGAPADLITESSSFVNDLGMS